MAEYICTHCGWEGERKGQLRGSKTVEMLIWSVLVVPGPIYSIWRRTGKAAGCPNCQMPTLVKLNSDAGWMARRKFDIELGVIQPELLKKDEGRIAFGNDKPTERSVTKKPVDPDQW